MFHQPDANMRADQDPSWLMAEWLTAGRNRSEATVRYGQMTSAIAAGTFGVRNARDPSASAADCRFTFST